MCTVKFAKRKLENTQIRAEANDHFHYWLICDFLS